MRLLITTITKWVHREGVWGVNIILFPQRLQMMNARNSVRHELHPCSSMTDEATLPFVKLFWLVAVASRRVTHLGITCCRQFCPEGGRHVDRDSQRL